MSHGVPCRGRATPPVPTGEGTEWDSGKNPTEYREPGGETVPTHRPDGEKRSPRYERSPVPVQGTDGSRDVPGQDVVERLEILVEKMGQKGWQGTCRDDEEKGEECRQKDR